MGFLDFLNPVFDFLLGWSLSLPPFWAIGILSLLMSVLIVVITKYTSDQDLMKHLKDESKALQKQIKELKDNPEKMLEVQKKHMESSMQYMRQSFKPLLWTFIPIILIFGWIQGHLAYEPIMPGKEFSVQLQLEKGISDITITAEAPDGITLTSNATRYAADGVVIFAFRAEKEGKYDGPGLTFTVNGKSYTKELLVTTEREYLTPLKSIRDKTVRSIETVHDKVEVIKIGSFSLSWLWSYIIFSIVFSSVLRKLFKVY